MNFKASPELAFCVLIALTGPQAASLCRGDEPLATDTDHRRSPVVTGPVLSPVMLEGDERASPESGCEAVVAPPLRSPAGPAGNASGLPFGASTRALFGAQIANGQAARMVLYRYDFIPGRAGLAPAGRRKLVRIAPVLVQSPFQLIIEPSRSETELDRSRRRTAIRVLAQLGYPVPDEHVVVAPPPSRGLQGAEAYGIYRRLSEIETSNTMVGGPPARFQP